MVKKLSLKRLNDGGIYIMMKKTHIITGVTLSSAAAIASGISITPMFVVIAAIGSIFPDLDHPKGALNQKILLVNNGLFKLITYLLLAGLMYFYGSSYIDSKLIIFIVIMLTAIGFSRHRSVTHSLFGAGFMAAFLYGLNSLYSINLILPFTLGILTHIFADMFNPEGVELLWPCKRNIRFPITVSTGGLGEKIVCYTFVIITLLIWLKEFNLI